MAVFRSGKVSANGNVTGGENEAGRTGETEVGGGQAESGGGQTNGRGSCSPGEGRKREDGRNSLFQTLSLL